mmetsp:Transcript_91788/g.259810  ORF Transcript_91788/g.259810 Transcript_91788/m.259810 type:complete len:280 (-) Transcript_91788:156-995(-)
MPRSPYVSEQDNVLVRLLAAGHADPPRLLEGPQGALPVLVGSLSKPDVVQQACGQKRLHDVRGFAKVDASVERRDGLLQLARRAQQLAHGAAEHRQLFLGEPWAAPGVRAGAHADLGVQVAVGGLDDPSLECSRHRHVGHRDADAVPDEPEDFHPLVLVGSDRVLDPHVQHRVQLLDARVVQQLLVHGARLLFGHADRDLPGLPHCRKQLEVAPSPLRVERVLPGEHKGDDAADAPHALCKLLRKPGVKRCGITIRLSISHPMLIDAKAAHPRESSFGF